MRLFTRTRGRPVYTTSRATTRIVAAFTLLLAIACGGDKSVTPTVLPDALRGVSVTPGNGSVVVGQTLTLQVAPDVAGAGVAVSHAFTSGAPAVATVSATGVVTGVSAGTSVIIVSSTGSGTGFTTVSKTATATIIVSPAPDALRGVTVSPTIGNVTVGQTLSITTVPDVAAASVVVSNSYSSSAPTVATVSPTGVISGVSPGTAVITVSATGSGLGYSTTTKSATIAITVSTAPDALRFVTVAPTLGQVFTGRTLSLTTTTDVAAPSVAVTTSFLSGTPAVASVSSTGVVTGVSVGTSIITVTAIGSGTGFATTSKTATATITVTQAPDALVGLTVSPATANVIVGSSIAITPLPQVASTAVVVSNTYASATPTVAIVSASGIVTGVAPGTAVITVTGTGVAPGFTTTTRTASATITVTPPIVADDQFASIPAGTFVMGSVTGGDETERPAHTVTLSAFQMQKTEVTQGQWRAVTGLSPSFNAACGEACPVESVSYDQIQSFLTRLNQLDPGKGYRLPTEAQWEYACRAGTTGDYGGNNVLDDMGWWQGNVTAVQLTQPVGRKRANAFGLFDMHGNVFELVHDWYSLTYYAISPAVDPTGPATGADRILRGGFIRSTSQTARSAYRQALAAASSASGVGFRLVRNP